MPIDVADLELGAVDDQRRVERLEDPAGRRAGGGVS